MKADYSTLWHIYESSMTYLSGFVSIAQALAAIGALLYISYRVWSSMAKAEPIDAFSLLRPFAIGLCLCFFQGAVLDPINKVSGAIDEYFYGLAEKASDDAKVKLQALTVVRNENAQKELKTKQDYIDLSNGKDTEATRNATSATDSFWNNFSDEVIISAIITLLRYICLGMEYIMRSLSIFYITILSLFGPLVFAISIFDGFQSSLTAWFSKYINFSLWGTICSILDIFLSTVVQSITQNTIDAIYIARTQGIAEASATSDSTMIAVITYLLGIVCFFSVPTISGWIVSAGGGAGPVSNAIKGAAGAVMGVAASAVGYKIGGSVGANAAKSAGGSFGKKEGGEKS